MNDERLEADNIQLHAASEMLNFAPIQPNQRFNDRHLIKSIGMHLVNDNLLYQKPNISVLIHECSSISAYTQVDRPALAQIFERPALAHLHDVDLFAVVG